MVEKTPFKAPGTPQKHNSMKPFSSVLPQDDPEHNQNVARQQLLYVTQDRHLRQAQLMQGTGSSHGLSHKS